MTAQQRPTKQKPAAGRRTRLPRMLRLPDNLRMPDSVARSLDAILDKSIAVQAPLVESYLERLRARRPTATPGEIVSMLERRYLRSVSAIGAAAGATAALPGVGTTASVASAAAEIAAFVEATTLFTLAVARVHGVRNVDPLYQRSLVLGVLLGGSGVDIVEQVAGTRARWAEVLAMRVTPDSMSQLNHLLVRHLVARFSASQGALLLGRAVPFGIGAGVGAIGNLTLARAAIQASRSAFGSPHR